MNLQGCVGAAREIDRIYLEPNCSDARQDSRGISYEHLRYMVAEMQNNMSEAKAMRWLGYIQGVLVSLGDATLEDMKELSKRFAEVEHV